MSTPRVRRGQGSVALSKDEFTKRFAERFADPAFVNNRDELDRLAETAWSGYHEYRKSPRTRPAGKEFSDPTQELPIEWLEARAAIHDAAKRHRSKKGPSRILLICGAARSDQTCPGEMSKSFRLLQVAQRAIEKLRGFEVDVLDLSHQTSQYGRTIHPCKACVSTAMPLCHWPCSCYPNHAMGQVNDWMNELYPRWVEAHAVIIVSPVYWYQAPSPLKLMIDRLVCADGGNPDPTATHGKDARRAKEIELAGWDFPRHLEGRVFGLVVHGDYAGAETLRRNLSAWLSEMELEPAGTKSEVDRYIGYLEPYGTSHTALDDDPELFDEVRNVARSVVERVTQLRAGTPRAGAALEQPRPK